MTRTIRIGVLLLVAILPVEPLGNSQSLAELARREAERRKLLEGVEGKTVRDVRAAEPSGGNAGTSASSQADGKPSEKLTSSKSGASLKSYRAAIDKLDREIGQTREKLTALRERLAYLRWAPPKAGKITASSTSDASLEKLGAQVKDLEGRLKQLERDRLQIYDEGRKAGYLPGELEGKGIVP